MRGTGKSRSNNVLRGRFIPACAGNSFSAASRDIKVTVHPRVCGEQPPVLPVLGGRIGSSPRVRGTDCCYGRPDRRHRFIPACAGNSPRRLLERFIPTVHPRVCAEQLARSAQCINSAGSSPRVRGTVIGDPAKLSAERFIPACAGNSILRATMSVNRHSTVTHYQRPNMTHPQEGGTGGEVSEILFFSAKSKRRPSLIYSMQIIPVCLSIVARRKGVSTTRRGGLNWTPISLLVGHPCKLFHTVRRQKSSTTPWRFIPACAGNSDRITRNVHRGTVHPRVCGEQWALLLTRHGHSGSSPRVRGTVRTIISPRLTPRFIPACAGNRSGTD